MCESFFQIFGCVEVIQNGFYLRQFKVLDAENHACIVLAFGFE